MTNLAMANTNSSNIAYDVVNTPANDYWQWWQQPTPIYPTYVYPTYIYPLTIQTRCAWCQGQHTDKCPRLKSVMYRPDGTIERVEFFPDK